MSEIARYDIKSIEYYSFGSYNSYRPEQVGTFVISNSGEFAQCNSASIPKLKRYEVPLNLNDEGFDPRQNQHDCNILERDYRIVLEEGEKPLKWLFETGYDVVKKVNVVTQRGTLRSIGNTLYNMDHYKNPWKFEVCKYGGKLYIRKDKSKEPETISINRSKGIFYSKAFVKHVIMEYGDVDGVYTVVTGTVGRHRTLLTAEVDAVKRNGQQVEVKTCVSDKLVDKIPTSWLQSYLAKVDVLHYGLQDKRGWLIKNEEISMKEVPLSRKYMPSGCAKSMFGLISDVLDWLQDEVKEGDTTWSFEYTGKNKTIILTRKGHKYLPHWYKEFVDNNQVSSLVTEVDALTLEHLTDN